MYAVLASPVTVGVLSALNCKEAEQRRGDATLSDELHAGHQEGRGDVEAERFWEDHYRQRGRVWSGRPNPVLVDVVESLPPGTALDLGCGEGGDAIWLARQRWRVMAVDVSATALARAGEDAAKAGVADRIDFQRYDLALTFPSGAFDLVSAQYLHSPVEFPRVRVLQEAASAVTRGGLLLIVDHASVSPRAWATPEETLAPLELSPDEWHTESLEARERETTGPNGQRVTVTDNVIALRRLAR
jgi:SAM-dependent methyltransferase